ncbi:MAG: ankyrin repeat domain-containing protein [Planctomycetota bacterium]|nr:ankyrin repeat domain-containing protein [Planctomycetota bacterium]
METLDPDRAPRDIPSDVPAVDGPQDRTTRLRAAVRAGDLETCRGLLAEDPRLVRATSAGGGSLALEAHEREHSEIADLLFSARGDGLDMDVHEAASLGRPNGVRNALTADPLSMDEVGPAGFFPVHRAAYGGHVDALLFLLEAGADPGVAAENASAPTPLHSAVAGMARLKTGPRGLEVLRLLIASGADPAATMAGGWTPGGAAADQGLTEAAELLDVAAAKATRARAEGP